MNNNHNKSMEEEFRSSQLYKTMVGSGSQVVNQVVQGLNQAAQSVDRAIGDITGSAGQGQGRTAYTQSTRNQPNGGYAYRNTYSTGNQPQQPNRAQYPQQPYQAPRPAQQRHPGQRPNGVNPAPAPQMPQMKMVRRGSPAKFYVTAAMALFYAMNFPLYDLIHLGVFALVMVGVFFLSSKLFQGKKQFVPVEPPKPQPKEEPKKEEAPKPSRTGNPEVDKIIDEGNDYLKKLRAANNAIPDQALTEDISRMEKASADIFRFIADHPDKAPEIRKFMSYYLPTTLKLLNSYQRLSMQSAKGETITSTMFNIAGMMHTVASAFEKQLDSLFTDEAMDVSADISVFETLLKQEGYVEDDVKPQSQTKKP